jgi:exopolysaccharide biosynthesis polyprenyl glycosylphosphotransferase
VARGGPAAHFRHLAHLADGAALLLAFPVAYLAKTRLLPAELTPLYAPEAYLGPAAIVALAAIAALARRGASQPANLLHAGPILASVALAIGQAMMLSAAVLFVFKLAWVSRLFVALYGATSAVLLVAVRLALRRVALRLRASGIGASRVLVIGEGAEADAIEQALAEEVAFGIEVVARIPADELALEESSIADGWLAQEAIDEVAIAGRPASTAALGRLIDACDREGVALHLSLDALAPGLGEASLEHVGDARMLSLNPQEHSPWGRAVKRAVDLVLAPILVAVLAPFGLLVAIAIKLDSPGPVFFVQERIGLSKRRFRMIKFRSMVDGAESLAPLLHQMNEADGPIFKVRRDPRVTRVGRWLRRFDVDELPQLLNVLGGDMSLIGPRPMLPSEIGGFEPWQRKRFSMLPGITGLWQVKNRLGQRFLTGLQADLEYIDRWSLWLDLKILLRTVPAILRDRVAP